MEKEMERRKHEVSHLSWGKAGLPGRWSRTAGSSHVPLESQGHALEVQSLRVCALFQPPSSSSAAGSSVAKRCTEKGRELKTVQSPSTHSHVLRVVYSLTVGRGPLASRAPWHQQTFKFLTPELSLWGMECTAAQVVLFSLCLQLPRPYFCLDSLLSLSPSATTAGGSARAAELSPVPCGHLVLLHPPSLLSLGLREVRREKEKQLLNTE